MLVSTLYLEVSSEAISKGQVMRSPHMIIRTSQSWSLSSLGATLDELGR